MPDRSMIAPDCSAGLPVRFGIPLQTMSCLPVQTMAEDEREFRGLGPAEIVRHESAAGS
jgi:hypothetical protein